MASRLGSWILAMVCLLVLSVPAHAELTDEGSQGFRQGEGLGDATEAGDLFGGAVAAGDFDGDGYEDLAIGVPEEDIRTVQDAGAVHVLYGGSGGLTSVGDQLWSQDGDVDGSPEPDDQFGGAVAAGDFDGDGYDDLAVGVPWEDYGAANAGVVNVLYGSPAGLALAGNRYWSQNSTGVLDTAEEGDLFGFAVAADDFDGDGYEDLAIGVPGEDIGTVQNAGAVHVLYGGSGGLTSVGDQLWSQDGEVAGDAEPGDLFGYAVAAGDFDGDGYDDLAVGVPYESYGAISDGVVNVLYGSPAGLALAGNRYWSQNSTGVLDTAEDGDDFGFALAPGDFDGDGYEDLAIGVPGEDIGTVQSAGAVHVLYGGSGGLTSVGDQLWSQDGDVGGNPEDLDWFGDAVAAGDFDGDGYDDLAVGVPYEDWYDTNDGAVNVLYGGSNGLTLAGNQMWSQNRSPWHYSDPETDDQFGKSLAAGDFDGNGTSDLAIGVPYEDWQTTVDSGIVEVLYGVGIDSDGDGILDAFDNCPHEPNGTVPQADTGGVGSGSPPDGIGDACQCGDINDSGIVDGIDYVLLNRSSLGLPPYGSLAGMPGFRKCNVNDGAGGPCNGVDGTLINRASLGLPPGISQDCLAANP